MSDSGETNFLEDIFTQIGAFFGEVVDSIEHFFESMFGGSAPAPEVEPPVTTTPPVTEAPPPVTAPSPGAAATAPVTAPSPGAAATAPIATPGGEATAPVTTTPPVTEATAPVATPPVATPPPPVATTPPVATPPPPVATTPPVTEAPAPVATTPPVTKAPAPAALDMSAQAVSDRAADPQPKVVPAPAAPPQGGQYERPADDPLAEAFTYLDNHKTYSRYDKYTGNCVQAIQGAFASSGLSVDKPNRSAGENWSERFARANLGKDEYGYSELLRGELSADVNRNGPSDYQPEDGDIAVFDYDPGHVQIYDKRLGLWRSDAIQTADGAKHEGYQFAPSKGTQGSYVIYRHKSRMGHNANQAGSDAENKAKDGAGAGSKAKVDAGAGSANCVTNEDKTVCHVGSGHVATTVAPTDVHLPVPDKANAPAAFMNDAFTADLDTATTTSTNTTVNGQQVWVLSSRIAKSTGAEHAPHHSPGIISGTCGDEARATAASLTCYFETKQVVREGDPTTQNKANTIGKVKKAPADPAKAGDASASEKAAMKKAAARYLKKHKQDPSLLDNVWREGGEEKKADPAKAEGAAKGENNTTKLPGVVAAGDPLNPETADAVAEALKRARKSFRRYIAYGDEVKVGGSLAWRANNPGNLRDSKAKIATVPGASGTFAVFATMEEGREAQKRLYVDKYGDQTVRSAIMKLTPPSENDTEKYLKDLEKAGVNLDNDVKSQIDTIMSGVEANEGMIVGEVVPRSKSGDASH